MKKESFIQFNKDAEKAIDNFCEKMTKVYKTFLKVNDFSAEEATKKLADFKEGVRCFLLFDVRKLSE